MENNEHLEFSADQAEFSDGATVGESFSDSLVARSGSDGSSPKKPKHRFFLTAHARKNIFIFFMLLFPLTQWTVCWLYVNFSSIFMAFQRPITGELCFDNFIRFFNEFAVAESREIMLGAIFRSFFSAQIGLWINTPLTILSTFLLFKGYYMATAFRIIYYIPGLFSSTIVYMLTRIMLQAGGPYMTILEALGFVFSEKIKHNGFLAVTGVAYPTLCICAIGIGGGNILFYTALMRRVPVSLFESAKLDGCGIWREFANIAVPLVWPTIATMVALSIGGMFGGGLDVMMLTGGEYGTLNFGLWMLRLTLNGAESTEYNNGALNYPAAIGVVLTCVMVPITLTSRKILNKLAPPVEY